MRSTLIILLLCFSSSLSFAQAGTLDISFGNGGKVTTAIRDNDVGQSVVVQTDGKIIVAGYAEANSVFYDDDFTMVRYYSNGSIDSTFGSNGIVITEFGLNSFGYSLFLQSDGKIILAGIAGPFLPKFAMARYKPNGTLDSIFGNNGLVITSLSDNPDVCYAVNIQDDQKILLTGGSGNFSGMARYKSNGTLDSAFGTNGKVITDVGNTFQPAHSSIIQSDGKILIAGTLEDDFIAVCYKADGTVDSTFGTSGKVRTDFYGRYDRCNSIALQADGKIILSGSTSGAGNRDIAVARYKPNGNYDSSFGFYGKTPLNIQSAGASGESMILQPDGKILVAGFSSLTTYNQFLVRRYNPNGEKDLSFGAGGTITTDFGPWYDEGHSIALQPDGKILVAGSAGKNQSYDEFAIARYNGDNILPPVITELCAPVASTGLKSAINATNYQWQLNTGTGFISITDNSNYFGTNTDSLQLNNIPSSWTGYQFHCLADGVAGNTYTLKFTNSWTGTLNNSWENAANWSCGIIPDSNTDVVINTGTVVVNSNVSIRSLTINTGVSFTVNVGFVLSITY